MDYVNDIAVADIDQHYVVIITHPAVAAICGWQAVAIGIVDPVTRAEKRVADIKSDVEPVIPVTAEWRIITA